MRSRFAVLSVVVVAVAGLLTTSVPVASAATGTAALVAAPLKAKAKKTKATKSKTKTKTNAKPKVKPVPVAFTVVGPVTAVDPAGSVTVTGVGGHKDLRNLASTILVTATTKVHVNDQVATLADVQVGFTATVVGTRTGGVLTARILNAEGTVPTPTPDPTPTVTPTPDPSPTDTPAPDPSPTDTPAP